MLSLDQIFWIGKNSEKLTFTSEVKRKCLNYIRQEMSVEISEDSDMSVYRFVILRFLKVYDLDFVTMFTHKQDVCKLPEYVPSKTYKRYQAFAFIEDVKLNGEFLFKFDALEGFLWNVHVTYEASKGHRILFSVQDGSDIEQILRKRTRFGSRFTIRNDEDFQGKMTDKLYPYPYA